MLSDLRASDDGRPLVQQSGERAQQPGLALAAFAEHHHVMAGDQRAFQLWQHGRLEADDAGPGIGARAQRGQQIGAQFGLDAAKLVTGDTEFADGGRQPSGRGGSHVPQRYARLSVVPAADSALWVNNQPLNAFYQVARKTLSDN